MNRVFGFGLSTYRHILTSIDAKCSGDSYRCVRCFVVQLFSRVAHVKYLEYLLKTVEMDVVESEHQSQVDDNNETNAEKSEQVEKKTKESEDGSNAGKDFEYLDRNEFTSEIFKIEVKNLGYFGIGASICCSI